MDNIELCVDVTENEDGDLEFSCAFGQTHQTKNASNWNQFDPPPDQPFSIETLETELKNVLEEEAG